MGKYDEVIANLAQVDDDALNSAHGEAKARIAQLRPKVADRSLSAEELEELVGLKDAFTQLNTEVTGRRERTEAAYGAADELLSLVPEDEGTAEAPAAAVEQPAEPVVEQVEEPQLVAASAATPEPKPATPKMGEVTKAAPKAPAGQAPMVITAAADVQGFSAGQQLELNQLGKAMSSRLRAVANSSSGDGEGVPVATIVASGVPEERQLRASDSVEHNTHKIHSVTSQQAIVAAGGLCAPLAIDYSYNVLGVQGRPIKNALPGFQVERGGIQYRKDLAPTLNTTATVPNGGPAAATGFWTMANDATVADGTDTTTRKAYWIVDCPSTVTAQVEAITFQIEFANITSRFDPETLQANVEAALIWHDRICENHLLAQLQALSKYTTSSQVLGATRDLLVNLDKLQAYYRSVYRLSDNVRLRAILPFWAKNMIRSDIARQLNDDGGLSTLAISDAQIDAFFETRNVSPVWHLDGSPTAVSTSGTANTTGYVPPVAAQQYAAVTSGLVVPAYPAQVDILLHQEGHFQHLDGGTLDLGIVRDADLVRRNRYRQFSESFEGVAARGAADAFRYVATVTPTGAMSGTTAPGGTITAPAAGWQ